jgi:probable rRNA maturation factor
VGNGRMRELNKKYRRKDKATDVLSFQYGNSGEVAICLKEVKKNAKKFKSTLNKELTRVLIHGILHVLGYSHKGMAKKESYYFEKSK